jgi:hypothetical protein
LEFCIEVHNECARQIIDAIYRFVCRLLECAALVFDHPHLYPKKYLMSEEILQLLRCATNAPADSRERRHATLQYYFPFHVPLNFCYCAYFHEFL